MNDWLFIKRTFDAQGGTGAVQHAGDIVLLESATDQILLESGDAMLTETTDG